MPSTAGTNSFHKHSLDAIIRALQNLSAILSKAEAHAAEATTEPGSLLQASLYPDMFNFIQQLQYACFLPVDLAQHFSDQPAPNVGSDEATFNDVQKSITITIDYLKAIPPERLAERATREVPVFFDGSKSMPAEDYASSVIMPDFYFHLTVAYAILRHNGVPLGKMDFLGPLKLKKVS